MKKTIALLLALCMVFTFAACVATPAGNTPTAAPTTPAPTTPAPTASAPGVSGPKLGMYIGTELSGTDVAAGANGNAETDSTVAAVLLDENGVIVDCIIDMAQTKIAFTAAGEVLNKDTEYPSKRQLGDAYGMGAVAAKGEWYLQAQGFCNYVIGKTADEVRSIAVDDSGHTTDEAITATTTIKVGGFIDAVTNACDMAQSLGSKAGDKLGLSLSTSIADSTDAAAGQDGTCSAYTYYCAVTANADKRVTAATLDATQSKISISAAGKVTTDLSSAKVTSKDVLKEQYGMKSASSIGLEWYQQAAGFCSYINGMTADEISGIAVDNSGLATDKALLATTTVHVGDFIGVATGAVKDAAAR